VKEQASKHACTCRHNCLHVLACLCGSGFNGVGAAGEAVYAMRVAVMGSNKQG